MSEERPVEKQIAHSSQPKRGAAPRVIDSADILCGNREVIIQHGAEQYRLRLTKAGKLILNK